MEGPATAHASRHAAIRAEIEGLVDDAMTMIASLRTAKSEHEFIARYQTWYTAALAAVRQLAPERLREFEEDYRPPREKNGTEFGIFHYVRGLRKPRRVGYEWVADPEGSIATVTNALLNQAFVVRSLAERLDHSLANIKGTVEAHLFDSEIEAARHLATKGHLRAAGAVAGVVLESHLDSVASARAIRISKRRTIANLNDALKDAASIDVPVWRYVQGLADIRNICDHKGREPTEDEIERLISGTKKLLDELS